jgi:hypothetical protein
MPALSKGSADRDVAGVCRLSCMQEFSENLGIALPPLVAGTDTQTVARLRTEVQRTANRRGFACISPVHTRGEARRRTIGVSLAGLP